MDDIRGLGFEKALLDRRIPPLVATPVNDLKEMVEGWARRLEVGGSTRSINQFQAIIGQEEGNLYIAFVCAVGPKEGGLLFDARGLLEAAKVACHGAFRNLPMGGTPGG